MTSPEGGFYSAQSADTSAGEGAFYLWTPQEIYAVLGPEDGPRACEYFGVSNSEGGASVLSQPHTVEEFAARAGMTLSACEEWLTRVKEQLFAARERREKPARDEKVLTAWNSLMISAFARAHQIFEDEQYLHAAQKAARFCLAHLYKDKSLQRSYKDGQAKGNAYLEDYAFLITALLDLYEADSDNQWLQIAKSLSATLLEKFWDEHFGGFYFTSSDHEKLPVRTKSFFDGATPSGNAAATFAFLRLAQLTGDAALRAPAEQTLRLCRDFMEQAPQAFSYMLSAFDCYLGQASSGPFIVPP